MTKTATHDNRKPVAFYCKRAKSLLRIILKHAIPALEVWVPVILEGVAFMSFLGSLQFAFFLMG